MNDPIINQKNLAETLSEVLPKATVLQQIDTDTPALHRILVAVPNGTEAKLIELDLEKHLSAPRATVAKAVLSDDGAFCQYVARHADERTVVWCDFNPQTYDLKFTAVFDEHSKDQPGWRRHKAKFDPDFSAEWKAWKGQDRKPLSQTAFAEWIEEHELDIAAAEGLPSALEMLKMATDFQMNEERSLKSVVKLQSGGIRMTFVADADKNTEDQMKVFEKFGLGLPVFHGGDAFRLTARLKYRNNSGKLSFNYEIQRPDKAHELAAKDLITTIAAGIGSVPLLFGSCA